MLRNSHQKDEEDEHDRLFTLFSILLNLPPGYNFYMYLTHLQLQSYRGEKKKEMSRRTENTGEGQDNVQKHGRNV